MLVVPPKESMTPRRKQKFYEFAELVYAYGEELTAFRESSDFNLETIEVQESIIEELSLIEKLNEFQVAQIEEY